MAYFQKADETRASPRKHRGLAGIWRLITTIPPRRSGVVLLCLLVAGVAEGIGVSSLLPLIAALDEGAGSGSTLSRGIVDTLQGIGLNGHPAVLLSLLVAAMTLKAGLVLLAMRQVGYAVADVATRIRLDLVDALLKARWGFFVHQPLGRFANAIGLESYRAGEAYNGLAQFLASAVQVVVYLLITFLVSWQVAVMSLLIGLGTVLSLNRLVVSAKRNARRQTRRMKTMVARLADVLVGIKPMKAMGREDRFAALFLRDLEVINVVTRRQVFSKNANKALQEPILVICLAIGIYYALSVWHMEVGEVVVAALLLAKTVSTVGRAQQDLQTFVISHAGYDSILGAIDDAHDAREITVGVGEPTFVRSITFDRVSFAYDLERPVIENFDLEITRGGVTAIIGPSGAGKTTLVDLVLGLNLPTQGQIRIDDEPLESLDLRRWRAQIGYVPQEPILFHDTIASNISLGEIGYDRAEVERALDQAGARDFVAQLPDGMDTVVGERGTLLSGGQRQRVAIARALFNRPKLLILDEATSALDPATEAAIVENVCSLATREGLTVLSISHQPAWAAAAEQVVRLEGGRVIGREPGPARAAAR